MIKKARNFLILMLIALVPILLPSLWPSPKMTFREEPLSIRTAAGTLHFTVEIAETDAQRMQGLMHRRAMAPDHGMLFVFDKDQDISMWMKNTVLPLDMLFIDRRGRIAYIAGNRMPYSIDPIHAGKPVRAVLELLGGTVSKNKIKTGNNIINEMIK